MGNVEGLYGKDDFKIG